MKVVIFINLIKHFLKNTFQANFNLAAELNPRQFIFELNGSSIYFKHSFKFYTLFQYHCATNKPIINNK